MLIEQRDTLKGEISVPGDKSISHRAIVLGSISKGTTEVTGLQMGEDCLSTIDCFRKMQISFEILSNNKIKINGKGLYGLNPPTQTLNTGRSGTSLRLILGILSAQPFNSSIIREELSMKKNSGKTVQLLKNMGASIVGKDNGNYCPLKISPSNLNGITQELQPYDTHIKSPLLLAGLYSEGKTTVKEIVKSRDHTELMLNHLGADIKVDGLSVSCKRTDNLYAQQISVPGDISFASYFISAGILAPNSDITIKNIGINPTRTGIIDIYKKMGAKIEIYNEKTISNEKVADIRVTTSTLKSTTIEGSDIPRLFDEIPVITVAATQAEGTTVIKDVSGFKIKKTGKLKHLVKQLLKMGANIEETFDGLIIHGGKPLKGSVVECAGDHTIALALSIAGLIAEGETMIRKAQIVDVIFPDYLSILNSL